MSIYSAITVCLSISLFLLLQGIFWSFRQRQQSRQQALARRLGGEYSAEVSGIDLTDPLSGAHAHSLSATSFRHLSQKLTEADIDLSPTIFLSITGTVIGTAALFGLGLTGDLGIALLLAMLSAVAIVWVIKSRISRRQREIELQLPKALELMIFSLRAGHSLEDAMAFASRDLAAPLGVELCRVHEQCLLGRPVESALLQWSARLPDCRSLHTFAEAVGVLKQSGGNIIYIMEQLIAAIRAQQAYQARFRALTAEGRTSGIILALIPLIIVVLLLIVQPSYIGLLFAPDHRAILYLIGLFWGSGILWVWRLTRPES